MTPVISTPPPPSGSGGGGAAPFSVGTLCRRIPAPRLSWTFTLGVRDLCPDPGGPQGEGAAFLDLVPRFPPICATPHWPRDFSRSDELPSRGGASVYILATPGVFQPPQSMIVCMGAPMCLSWAAPNLRNACHLIVFFPPPPLEEADQELTQGFPRPMPSPPVGVEQLEGPVFDQELQPLSPPGPQLLVLPPPPPRLCFKKLDAPSPLSHRAACLGSPQAVPHREARQRIWRGFWLLHIS